MWIPAILLWLLSVPSLAITTATPTLSALPDQLTVEAGALALTLSPD